jgi:nucleoside-diphosphate-sugar epimerase
MKIFLTGATGYTGGVVLNHLLAAGHEVAAIARRLPESASVNRKGLLWIEGDFGDRTLVEKLARQADGVLHIGASHDKEMERLDGIVIRSVADALAGSGRVFVSTSATPVYGDTGNEPRDEHEPIEHPHPLRAWRMRHDQEVVKLDERNIRGVVIRPGYIYGQSGGLLSEAIRVARLTGKARYIGDGRRASSTVHVDALAKLYILALENNSARGIYNAASDEVVFNSDICEIIAALYGPGIVAQAWPIEEARKTLGEYADLANITCIASSARARQELGWLPVGTTLLGELVSGSYRIGPLQDYALSRRAT